MDKHKNYSVEVQIANLFLLRLLLLKTVNYNLYKYIKILNKKETLNLYLYKKVNYLIDKGFNQANILRYISKKASMKEIDIILTEYELTKRIDENKISAFLERNKNILENIVERLNIYFIILIATIYPLPVVLMLTSQLLGLNNLYLISIPVAISLLIIKHMKKSIRRS